MNNKWVFETLVQDEQDAVGLIAYALYKNKKHNLAKKLRLDKRSELDIANQVKIFHDHTLHNQTDDYLDKATIFLDGMFKKVEAAEKVKYDAEIAKLKASYESKERQLIKECDTKIKKERKNFIANVNAYDKDKKHFVDRAFAWIISGIPGAIASFVLSAFLIGASVMLVPDSKKQEIFTSLATEYLGIKNPPEKGR